MMAIIFIVWFITMHVMVQSKSGWVRALVFPLLLIPFGYVAGTYWLGIH